MSTSAPIVKKGQKLAELSAVDYRNKVTAAEADLAAAKAALAQAAAQEERFRILLGKGFATRSQYDDALKVAAERTKRPSRRPKPISASRRTSSATPSSLRPTTAS